MVSEREWARRSREKKDQEAQRRRREIRRRIGLSKFYEELGRMIYKAYPEGQMFDLETGEILVFQESPQKFIRVAIKEAEKLSDEWLKSRKP